MIKLNCPVKPDLKKLQIYLEKIDSAGWFTNFGPLHQELTLQLEEYLGVKNLLLVNNGTSALQVAGQALSTKSVLTTPFSFVATISAFKWNGNQAAFADIDRGSYNLSPTEVEKAYRNGCKADTLVATHVYGNPCDVLGFEQLSKQLNVKVIYDAAHAFAIKIGEGSVLNYGDASILSFHATKVFHTLEGGAIIFKEKENYNRAKELINFSIRSGQGITGVGTNAKLNEYQAAVGLVNLASIDDVLQHRTSLFHAYRQALKDVVDMPVWHAQANFNGAYMPILLKNDQQVNSVSLFLAENNIQSRHYFSPSLHEVFSDEFCYGAKHSTEASRKVLCLPLHAYMSLNDVRTVIAIVKRAIK